jgi:hypothetical protein
MLDRRVLARGGSWTLEALWITAQQCWFGVHPLSPLFLYAYNDKDLETLSTGYAQHLQTLQRSFRVLVGLSQRESETLLVRLVAGPPPSAPAMRRELSATLRTRR